MAAAFDKYRKEPICQSPSHFLVHKKESSVRDISMGVNVTEPLFGLQPVHQVYDFVQGLARRSFVCGMSLESILCVLFEFVSALSHALFAPLFDRPERLMRGDSMKYLEAPEAHTSVMNTWGAV